MPNVDEVDRVAAYADHHLTLATAQLSDSYYYVSLPLCVLDAVYSIGVRYEGVLNVVERYCTRFNVSRYRKGEDRGALPPTNQQESVSTFCARFAERTPDQMADEVFQNRQRTSARNGILKAEAVYLFASALKAHGVEFLQDVSAARTNKGLENAILSIPGQKSGVSLQYFWMLSGSDNFVKPDRMVRRFLEAALERQVDTSEAQGLMSAASEKLKPKYPHITPRLLDYEVWQYARAQLDDAPAPAAKSSKGVGGLLLRPGKASMYAFYKGPGSGARGRSAQVFPGGMFGGLSYDELVEMGAGRHEHVLDDASVTDPGPDPTGLPEWDRAYDVFEFRLFLHGLGACSSADVLDAARQVPRAN
ncbi:MAG: hypothetical protein U0804_12670 [Gemmataceae bacterium]